MAAPGIWSELGIAPTADPAAIRRAYAARVKAVRPDTDPQGFARLREAYERALRAASSPEPARERVRADPEPRPVEPPVAPALGAAEAALRAGDVLGAATWLAEARGAGALSLQQDIHLADRLGWAMAQDRGLPADAVRAAAERLGWLRGDATAPWARPLRARLEAEEWLAGLRRDAGSRWAWLGASRPVSARILLGRGKLRSLRSMGADPRLRRRYGEFLLHAPAVGDQFDPARIEAVAALLRPRRSRVMGAVGLFFGVMVLAGLVGAAVGDVAPQLEGAATGLTTLVLAAVLLIRGAVRRWRKRA